MERLTIELDLPIAFEGGTVARITLREPTFAEVRMAEEAMASMPPLAHEETAYQQKLIAAVAGVPLGVAQLLPARKAMQAVRFLEGFILEKRTGEGEGGAAAGEAYTLHPDTLTIELDPPIVQQGVTHDTLELREPTLFEHEQAERMLKGIAATYAQQRDKQHRLITLVSGKPAAVVRALPFRKVTRASRYLESFRTASPSTGAA